LGYSWGLLAEFTTRLEPAQGPAAEVGRRIVAHIPTRFGRLVFLHSLRDAASGRYSHPVLNEKYGRETADRALSHAHHQTLMEWLRLNLADQKDDLDEYLRIAGANAADLPYREFLPPSARDVERQLYLTDLEVVLHLISFE
jgi:hypothetical protein